MINHRRWMPALYVGLLLLIAPVHAKRIALAIGNDNYRNVSKLQKAGNDALAMAAELTSAGYQVTLQRDLDYRGMVRSLETLYGNIAGGDEVIVFFAGHGVQIRSGSFLLPIDIEATSETEVERTSYALHDLMERLEQAKASFSLVLVDACRDNPLSARGRSVGGGRGLNPPDPPKGQMVVYSASRGQQALDRLSETDANPNGVFTREFIKGMRKPGLRIDDLVRETQESVERLARSANHEQRPAVYNEARGNFYFFPPAAVAATVPTAAVPDDIQREDRFWEDTKSAGNRDGFEAYLELYPNGRYARLARANISRITGSSINPTLSSSPLASIASRPSTPGAAQATAAPATATALQSVPAAEATAKPNSTAPAGGATTAPPPPAVVPAPPVAASAPPTIASVSPQPTIAAAAPAVIAAPTRAPATPRTGRREASLGETLVVGSTSSGARIFRLKFANGDAYEGELTGDELHGKGTQTFVEGDVYIGEFKRGTRSGRGTFKYANGERYEGDFENDAFHGKGRQTFVSGDVYDGDFVKGRKVGTGTYRFANGDVYEGQFVDDKFHGAGKHTLRAGDVYEGEFQNGMKNGRGTYRFANGDRFEGTFTNNSLNGRGVIVLAGGDRYEGDILNNQKEGRGIYSFPSGDRYEGEFRAGKQAGSGTYFYANGERFVGNFVNGVQHGMGVFYSKAGEPRPIEYDNGAEKAK